MDDERTAKAVWVLPIDMRMVPVCSWLVDLEESASESYATIVAYGEVVGDTGTWRHGTLRALGDTIHKACTVLIQAVPMDRGRLISQAVLHIDNESVAHVHLDARDGPLTIDANDWSRMLAIWVSFDPADVQVVCLGGSADERDE